MKYAYYEVVATQEEKERRLQELQRSVGSDPNYFSAYLEVAPPYDAAWKSLRAMCSMKAAVRRGSFQVLVIPSLLNLQMSESRAVRLLKELMDKGVQIALGAPENLQTEESIRAMAEEARMEYLYTVLSVPLITMESCELHYFGESAFVYLEKDVPEKHYFQHTEKMLFIDLVRKFLDTGFFLYRSDMQSWYHISADMALELEGLYRAAYDTLFDVMNLKE